MTWSLADIHAMCDVLDDIGEASDDIPSIDAIEIKDAITALRTKATTVIGLLDVQILSELDGQPIQHNDRIFTAERTGKWRPDQSRIRSHVVRAACVNDDGEMLPTRDAVDRAVRIMNDLFVSPATVPKQTGLKLLGLTNKDVCDWEHTGTKLKEINVGGISEDR